VPDTDRPFDADRALGSLDPRYVGDDACVACHGPIAESYARTNHGRSLEPVSAVARRGDGAAAAEPAEGVGAWVHSPADGLGYRAEVRGDRLAQHEVLADTAGAPVPALPGAAARGLGYGNTPRT
jgi:hypothetical protein